MAPHHALLHFLPTPFQAWLALWAAVFSATSPLGSCLLDTRHTRVSANSTARCEHSTLDRTHPPINHRCLNKTEFLFMQTKDVDAVDGGGGTVPAGQAIASGGGSRCSWPGEILTRGSPRAL